MNSSLSIDFSDTSTQIEEKRATISRLITHNFLSTKLRDPREESFFDMLKINVFPMLCLFSLTTFLCLSIFAVFVVQLIFGGISGPELLQPGPSFISDVLLATRQMTIHDKHLYQLFSCQFLHENAISLFSNIFLLCFTVSWAEAILGPFRSFIAFFLTVGATNALVALYLQPEQSIEGLNTGIYGLLGAGLGCLVINWPNLYFMKFPRVLVFWMLCILIGFSMIFARTYVAITCQLMGVTVGILVGLFCAPFKHVSENESKKFSSGQKVLLAFGFLSYFVTLVVCVCLIILV